MDIICISNCPASVRRLHLGRWSLGGVATFLLLTAAVLVYGGYRMGSVSQGPLGQATPVTLPGELEHQREVVAEARRRAEDDLNALALSLGQMQAHIIRLDALGQRLVEMAGLDSSEFDFTSPPAVGGPEGPGALQSNTVGDFLGAMDAIARQLEDREQKLGVLQNLMMNRRLQAEVEPTGRPIERGWISSYFGRRTDPITGKKAFHEGIDFAGKRGSEVVAVAAGVVTWSGKRHGYGNLVEINHGGGLVTRYGHNQKNLVKVGDKVEKGQIIARMGSTGRSTGPHVHFEVLRDGKPVNPIKYVQATN